MIDLFEERIGTPYPYARYSQIAVRTSSSAAWKTRRRPRKPTGRFTTDARTSISPAIRSSRTNSHTSGSATCSRAAIGRTRGSTKASRPTSSACGAKRTSGYDEYLYDVFGCVARTSTKTAERYRASDRLQPLSRSDRAVRPAPLRKGRRGAAHAARHARRRRASGARSGTTSRRMPAERRDDRSHPRDRRGDGPQPARLLRPVGPPARPPRRARALRVRCAGENRDGTRRAAPGSRSRPSRLRVRARTRAVPHGARRDRDGRRRRGVAGRAPLRARR